MFITGTWQRGARCFLIAITDPPGFCSACTLPTAQGQGQKDQLFFWSPDPIVRPSVQLYSLDLINSELFRWGGPGLSPAVCYFFPWEHVRSLVQKGVLSVFDFSSWIMKRAPLVQIKKELVNFQTLSGPLSDCLGLFLPKLFSRWT